jgi:outer membrane autotransporter protein
MTDTSIYANSIPGTVFYEGPTLKARSEINTANKSFDIIFEQKSVAAVPGLAANQQSIAATLDAAVVAGTVPDALIGSINLMRDAHSIGQVLNQLTPQSYEGLFMAAVARTDSFANVVGQRLELIKANPRPAHKWETHLQGYSITTDSRRGLENGDSSIDTQGVQAGLDYSFSETFAAGLAFGYDFTKNDLDAHGSTGNVDACNVGIYGAYAKDNLSVHALGYYGADSYSLRRSIALTSLGDRVAADPNGHRMGIDIEVGRKIEAEAWSVTPFAGLHYMNWQVDGFTENGPEGVALAVDKQSESAIHSRFGLGISREIDLRSWTWRPYVQAAWVHEFKNSARTLSATGFGNQRVSVKSSQEAINGDGISAEGGLTLVVSENLSGYIGFTYSNYAGIRNGCTLKGGITYRF